MDRDMTGGSGSGMSGSGAGGSGAMGGAGGLGGGEVHTRLSSNPTEVDIRSTPRDSETGASGAEGLRDRVEDMAGEARERVEGMAGEARERARELGNRASHLVDDAQERLEETGFLNVVRDNPLPALGVAFGVGYLLAGTPDTPRSRTGRAARGAKKQLRGVLLGSLSAMAMQEVQSMFGFGGNDDEDESEGRASRRGRSGSSRPSSGLGGGDTPRGGGYGGSYGGGRSQLSDF
jgi:ElaB/YqjD/DUF883 family membrane-anchored ribosome-binding protein